MLKIVDILYKWPATIIHILVLPFFFLDFILIYHPLDIMGYMDTHNVTPIFNVMMLFCICLLVFTITRLGFHFLNLNKVFNYMSYAFWCVGEIMIFSAFAAMYISLISGGVYAYFDAFGLCYAISLLIFIYPYIIVDLSMAVHWLRNNKNAEAADPSLIRFRDGSQRLKLAISASSLYYVEASENYVNVCYEDRSGIKTHTLRSSMKNVEAIVAPAGIVRCHRTYFVNPAHIRLIGKTAEGCLYAELDNDQIHHIPISRTYYGKLSTLL